MTGAEILTRFTADTSGVDKATSGFNVGLGKLASAFTIANVAAQAINKTISVFTSNLDSAISRFDTMNNYPKVMKLFGVSSDEASASIDRIDQSVRGLPTSLDQAVKGVQDLFMVTQDLEEAEKLFQSVNDSAMVFANGSTEAVNNFIYGYKQALSAGKISAQDFNQMNQAIPGLMTKVADVIGVSYAELKDGLSNGSISISQFNTALKTLDTEGVGAMSSLQEAAKTSTGGIATNITNMKTAITRGITNMISSVDEALEPFGGLSGVISKIGKVGEKTFNSIGKILKKVIPKLVAFGEWLKEHKVLIIGLTTVIGSMVVAYKTLQIVDTIKNMFLAFKTAIVLVQTASMLAGGGLSTMQAAMGLLNLTFLASPIFWVITGIVALVAAIVLLWNNCEDFRNVVLAIFDAIKNALKVVFDFFKGVFDGIVQVISNVIDWVKNNWQYMIGFIVNPFGTAFKMLYDKCEGFRNFIDTIVNKVKSAFSKAGETIKKVFTAVRDTVANIFQALGNMIKSPINAIISGINKVLKKINDIKIPDWVPGIGGKHTNFGMIPQLRVGTNYVPQDTLAVIHKGEAVVPKKFNPYANGVRPQTIGTMNASTPSVNVVVNANFETDPLGQMVSKIKTFSGGAKNDYNYGMGVR